MSFIEGIRKSEVIQTRAYEGAGKIKQLILGGTLSSIGTAPSVKPWWGSFPNRPASHFIIDRRGNIWQNEPLTNWCYYLNIGDDNFARFGLTNKNEWISKSSIVIELDNVGPVETHGGVAFPPVRSCCGKVKADTRRAPVREFVFYEHGWCGYNKYEKYPKKQLTALKKLLTELKDLGYPVNFEGTHIATSQKALSSAPGLWFSTAFFIPGRNFMVHPQKDLLTLLKGL